MREQYMRTGEGFLMVFSIMDKNRCATSSAPRRVLAHLAQSLYPPGRPSWHWPHRNPGAAKRVGAHTCATRLRLLSPLPTALRKSTASTSKSSASRTGPQSRMLSMAAGAAFLLA